MLKQNTSPRAVEVEDAFEINRLFNTNSRARAIDERNLRLGVRPFSFLQDDQPMHIVSGPAHRLLK